MKSPVAKVMADLPFEIATMFPELSELPEVATQHHAAKSLAG